MNDGCIKKDSISPFLEREHSSPFEDFAIKKNIYVINYIDMQKIQPFKKQNYYMHTHETYEIIIPTNKYSCLLNDCNIELSKNQLLIIKPFDKHCDYLDPEEKYITFRFCCFSLFNAKEPFNIFRDNLEISNQMCNISAPESLECLINLLWLEMSTYTSKKWEVVNSIFKAIFWQIIISFPENTFKESFLEDTSEAYIKNKILVLFEQHKNEIIDSNIFCKKLNISNSTLTRLCHLYFGAPITKSFMSYKMNYAKQILQSDSVISIKEISSMLGFKDQFHFSRVFKKIIGYAPSTIQKR